MYDRSCANNDIADAGVNICKITLAKLTTLIMETMLTEMINSGPRPLVRWKSRTSISTTTPWQVGAQLIVYFDTKRTVAGGSYVGPTGRGVLIGLNECTR